jgi:glycosyltransferase involved in cell wall biosynthesis
MQNMTLAFFAGVPPNIKSHFLTTRWTDGEFDRRLDALGIPRSPTWFGMFSRKLDRDNLHMTLACLGKLPVTWWDFLRLYFSFRPDVIYFANYHEVILLSPMLIWLRRKVVCHMHDPPPPGRFQNISFMLWRRTIGRFVFVSQNTRDRLAQLGPLNEEDAVIYNGVQIAPLAWPRVRSNLICKMFGWPPESVIFGVTGQISADKGHEDFLQAALAVHASNPNFKFIIGGRGSETFADQLRQQIAGRDMQAHVGFSGWLPRAADFYEAIDVLVLPSRHNEGFGLVVAEAGERGVPTIATPSGGATEVLVDGETGLLVRKHDPESLAAAMQRSGSDQALRERLGLAARNRIASKFDLRTQTRKFAEFLLA